MRKYNNYIFRVEKRQSIEIMNRLRNEPDN